MNPLFELIPAPARKWLYAIVSAAAFLFSAYQAAQGDWATAAASLIPSLTGALAASNTDVKDPGDKVDGHDTVPAEPDEVPFTG